MPLKIISEEMTDEWKTLQTFFFPVSEYFGFCKMETDANDLDIEMHWMQTWENQTVAKHTFVFLFCIILIKWDRPRESLQLFFIGI